MPPDGTGAPPASGREYGLDWLRVFAFAVLIFYHSGMVFVTWGYHIKNDVLSTDLEYVMLFFNRWRLPLLFFISGAGVAFSLRRRGLGAFALERFRRLFIPIVFGMLVVVPPQIYFERTVMQHVRYPDYFAFWATVFEGVPYPKGSLSWHHLWFVVYIFVYSIAFLPVFAALRSASGQRCLESSVQFLTRHRWAIYLLSAPGILNALVLGPRWPTTHNLTSDWANLVGSAITFLLGFVFASRSEALQLIEERRREWLIGWIVMLVPFYGRRMAGWGFPGPLEVVFEAYLGMLAVLALVGYSRHYLNRDSPLRARANEAVYPFYILHQTVIIALAAWWIVPWHAPVIVELPLLTIATFVVTWLLYCLIERVSVLRLAFGMRPPVPRRDGQLIGWASNSSTHPR